MNKNHSLRTSDHPTSFFDTDKRYAFLLICLGTFLLLYVKKTFIENETAVFEFLQDRPEGAFLRLITALQYLSIPLVYAWKFTVVSFVIWVGCFMYGYRVTYSQCWSIALVAEFIFFLPEIIKIAWFLGVDTDPDFNAVRAFYPLSLLHLFDYADVSTRFVYPLKALNVFEIGYWFLLIKGVSHFARQKILKAGLVVLSSYVLLFFSWLAFYTMIYD